MAPGWPGDPDTVADARANPDQLANRGIDEVTDHYAEIIADLSEPPIIIGHSFGGMIAEKLLGEDYGAAAIAIDAAQIKGVLPLPLSALHATLPVLIHGGAGGVGAFAVQFASEFGAHVFATARASDVEFVASLRAEKVIDFETEDFDTDPAVYDVVIDTVGGSTLERSYAALRPGGRLVTLQAPPSLEKAREHEITAKFFVVTPDRDQLSRIAALVAAGNLQIAIAATFPLADGRRAYESGSGTQRRPGKTVLIVR